MGPRAAGLGSDPTMGSRDAASESKGFARQLA